MLSNQLHGPIRTTRSAHRRQNSSPIVPYPNYGVPYPTDTRAARTHRRGNSLQENLGQTGRDIQGNESFDTTNLALKLQDDLHKVSTTNQGHHSIFQPDRRNSMQAAQQLPAQPGPPSPQSPQIRAISPTRGDYQQLLQPSDQQMKDLEQHIKSVYGEFANVCVNVIPSPVQAPAKLARSNSFQNVDSAPMPNSINELANVRLEPTEKHRETDIIFENPESDVGYDSSYYSSDAFSPSRSIVSSPDHRHFEMLMEDVYGESNASNGRQDDGDIDALLSPTRGSHSQGSGPLDELIEDTGISSEEVQMYISEQDPTTKRWTCMYPECAKTFGRRENIRSHVQTHLGDRQFRCPSCSKCFVRQHDLKRHLKIHSGNKPYRCPCGNGFARQDALTRHRQRGNCSGGVANPNRPVGRRGRPPKRGPGMEKRVEKANRARKADVIRENRATRDSLSPLPDLSSLDPTQVSDILGLEPSSEMFSDPFRNSASSPAASQGLIDCSSPMTASASVDDIFNLTSKSLTHTPPSSPGVSSVPTAQVFGGMVNKMLLTEPHAIDPSLEQQSDASQAPELMKSVTLTTPPTSPLQAPSDFASFCMHPQAADTSKPRMLDAVAGAGAVGPSMYQDMPLFSGSSDFQSGPDAQFFKYDCTDWLNEL